MRSLFLLALLSIGGCATTSKPARTTSAPPAKPDPLRAELRRARQAMARGAFDEAESALRRADALTGGALAKRIDVHYHRATLALYRGDVAGAAALLDGDLMELVKGSDRDLEFWAHNELTWVRWASGDLTGALKETEEQRRNAESSASPPADKASLLRHALWDRAYLLRELASKQPPPSREATLSDARAARAEYDRAALAIGGEDGQAVLEAFFALSDGDGASALRAAQRVDAKKDDDVQDLYILALALEAGGDSAAAEAIRARIRASDNVYLGLPMYLHQLDLDGRKRGH